MSEPSVPELLQVLINEIRALRSELRERDSEADARRRGAERAVQSFRRALR